MNRHPTTLIFTLIIIPVFLAGIWYTTRPKPVAVVTKAVTRGTVEETVANTRAGTVKACKRARLSPGTGGQIARLDIREGDRVKAGALLLELWNKDLLAEIELNESEAKATLSSARAVCLQAEVAHREAGRRIQLRKTGAVSEDAVDKAVTDSKAHQADCEAANATARISRFRSDIVRAKMERTRLIAPFEGVIAEIHGELNEYVTPSPPGIATSPVVDLIDTSCFYVAAPIDEVDAPRIILGQPAWVTLDAFGDRRFPGTVRRIAPYVLDKEKQARTVEVEVEFSDKGDIEQLLAGYSADVEIILNEHQNTLRIPTEAVLEDGRVLLLPEDGVLEERKIESGISNWDHTEILSGLKEGDLIVTSVDFEGVDDGVVARRKNGKQP